MERRQSEALSDVLRRFMRESGLESPLNQYRVMNVWAKVVGDFAARQTSELFIRNQTLYVRLSSPALKSDLMMKRKQLAQQLNEEVGAFVVVDVSFV
jgi:predicted nucleic acid-binding Zn ribbon protein